MPCRYNDDDYALFREIEEMREELDKLSRIACKALTHIEESGDGLEILVLRHPEIQEWWAAYKEADRKAKLQEERRKAARIERERKKKLKEQVL